MQPDELTPIADGLEAVEEAPAVGSDKATPNAGGSSRPPSLHIWLLLFS
jgi:hypothetical protein